MPFGKASDEPAPVEGRFAGFHRAGGSRLSLQENLRSRAKSSIPDVLGRSSPLSRLILSSAFIVLMVKGQLYVL